LAFCGDDGVDVDAVAADVVAAATVDEGELEFALEVGGTVTEETTDGAADPSAPQPVAMSVRTIDATR
jgi:hypothetical protein